MQHGHRSQRGQLGAQRRRDRGGIAFDGLEQLDRRIPLSGVGKHLDEAESHGRPQHRISCQLIRLPQVGDGRGIASYHADGPEPGQELCARRFRRTLSERPLEPIDGLVGRALLGRLLGGGQHRARARVVAGRRQQAQVGCDRCGQCPARLHHGCAAVHRLALGLRHCVVDRPRHKGVHELDRILGAQDLDPPEPMGRLPGLMIARVRARLVETQREEHRDR